MTAMEISGRRIPLKPRDGWVTLGLVLLLCLSFAWSLDDALLVLGKDDYTDFLAWTAVGGVLLGFVGATVGWGRWRTFLIGALFAALVTPLLVGSVLIPAGAAPGDLFRATAEDVVTAWRDLIVEGDLSTRAYGHHLLLLGLIVWGSSLFASFAAFGHRRPLNAVILIGFLLVANMSLTVRDQLVYLVLYSLASLFLLIRFHTLDEQADWIRRRIGDPSAISGLYLRGGTIFIVTAVLGSLLLTTVAASKPLAGVWTDMGGRVIEWSQFLERYLPVSGSGRSIGPAFGADARIDGVWQTSDGVALTWRSPITLENPPYFAAAIYDQFELTGWRMSESTWVERAAMDELLAGTEDALTRAGKTEFVVTVTPEQDRATVFTPEQPYRINGPARVRLVGGGDYLAQIEQTSSGDAYTVTALIPGSEEEGGPTENRLRVAGQDYPAGIVARYGKATVPEGTIATEESRALLAEIVERADDNPYDIAAEMVRTLQDPTRFKYDADVRNHDCGDLSIVDCFVQIKEGYCEYYATTMAMMLRELGIPTRYVKGFLPGERDPRTGTYEIQNLDAHAWVQVYFPGHGWITFDPTGGGRDALPAVPSGEPVASPSAGASVSAIPSGLDLPSIRAIPEPAGGPLGPFGGGPGTVGPFIAIALLLGIGMAALAAVAWRRGPRGNVTPDDAYGMVTRLASRLGFAPRPNQTVYEYAGSLAEVLPAARPQLEVVAQAKVEVAYGGRNLTDDRLASLREAQRRLRTSLLGLIFRRDKRPKRR